MIYKHKITPEWTLAILKLTNVPASFQVEHACGFILEHYVPATPTRIYCRKCNQGLRPYWIPKIKKLVAAYSLGTLDISLS